MASMLYSSSQYSDVEMLAEPLSAVTPISTLENNDPLISEVFRLTNGIVGVEDGDSPMQLPPAPDLSKKPAKKRKIEKNTSSSGAAPDLGSSSIPSPCSSIMTLSSVTPAKPKPSTATYAAAKDKERNLIYVSYLNAFANSLTVHPPLRRTGQKVPGGPVAEDTSAAVGSSLGCLNLDFDHGGSHARQTTPYLPDVDRDRCGHTDSFCPFSKRDGYSYCEKHLLDDKGLPFVPCAFQRLDANPCPYPAKMPPGAGGKNRPQRSKEALCSLHMEKCLQEVKQHMSCSANAIFSTMDSLAAYNSNIDKGLPPTNMTDILEDLAESQTRDYLETYLRATAKDTYATSSLSEDSVVDENEIGLFRSRTFDTDDELDSGEDEPLKYAHHYSVEELTRLLRVKISKHKELLAGEMRLQEYKLKDARAKYLTEVMEERSFLPSVHTQARHDPESCSAYRDIRTMLRVDRKRPRFSYAHARKPGVILRHAGKMPDSVFRCLHVDTGSNGKSLKCRQFSLPFSRHCLSHIMEDQYQYLYKCCAARTPTQCRNPILKNMGTKYCYHHTDLNIVRSGPDLSRNDSHTQGSSSSDLEVEATLLQTEAAEAKSKRVHKRSHGRHAVFLPRLDSDSPVTVQPEIPVDEPRSPESSFPVKEEEMVVEENNV